MQNITTARILGRTTASTGDIEQLTATQVTAMLDNFTTTLDGLVPASGGGTTNFLRADGTWSAPPGVTLVDGQGLTFDTDHYNLGGIIDETETIISLSSSVDSYLIIRHEEDGTGSDFSKIEMHYYSISSKVWYNPFDFGEANSTTGVDLLYNNGVNIYANLEGAGTGSSITVGYSLLTLGASGAGTAQMTLDESGDVTITTDTNFIIDLDSNGLWKLVNSVTPGTTDDIADGYLRVNATGEIYIGDVWFNFAQGSLTEGVLVLGGPTVEDWLWELDASIHGGFSGANSTWKVERGVTTAEGLIHTFITQDAAGSGYTYQSEVNINPTIVEIKKHEQDFGFIYGMYIEDINDTYGARLEKSHETSPQRSFISGGAFGLSSAIAYYENRGAGSNTSVSDVLRLRRNGYGLANALPGTGMGSRLSFELQNDNATLEYVHAAGIVAEWLDATNGSEDSLITIEGRAAGSLVDFMQLGNGIFTLPTLENATTTDVLYYDSGTGEISYGTAPSGGAGVTDGDKGDITVSSTGAVWTIDNDAVSFAKMQDIATNRILGRTSASSGNIEELTPTQITAMLDNFTSGLDGLAPASGGGTSNFLRADGNWAIPSVFGTKGFPFDSPTNAENSSMMRTDVEITITKVADLVRGSSTPSITWNVRYASTRDSGSPTDLFGANRTTTSTAGVTTTSITNPVIPAGSFIWLVTSALSGTVNELFIELYWEET
jgi:hypothetical protein